MANCVHCKKSFKPINKRGAVSKFCPKHRIAGQKQRLTPEAKRAGRLWWKFKIKPEEWAKLFEEQSGGCAVCGQHAEENGKRLAVDHDHHSGKVRGLLCFRCNTVLGKVGDCAGLLRILAEYLEAHDLRRSESSELPRG